MESKKNASNYGLENHGIVNYGQTYWNLGTPALYEEVIRRREGNIVHLGPLVVRTGQYTGRAAQDKFIVEQSDSKSKVWWGKSNQPISERNFEILFHRLLAYIQGRDLFIQDCFAGADPRYRLPIRVITESAWHSLFARNLFIQAKPEELQNHRPEFTIIHMPHFHALPSLDGTNSETFIILNLARKMVLIGGTSYAGEIKKSVFSILNFLYPQNSVLSMHCSANLGRDGDVALFFGLSGTGKTSLSADPERSLIGDDEHGWSDSGIFNFEGGCYAKVIRLSPEAEPDIYETTRKFGTILENVAFDPYTRKIDLNDDSLTENTRAAYPLTHINNIHRGGTAGHPKNVVFLTSDAFGVMPLLARLNTAQAMYHFISGYTAKLGGTESGDGAQPKAVFSACYGAPFMVLHPFEYAKLLEKRLKSQNVKCWLINTGWTGGPYGVGSRVKIAYSRAMVKAAITGKLDDIPMMVDPVFGFEVPTACPGVPTEVLNPRNTWPDKSAYDIKVLELGRLFKDNFKAYEKEVSAEVVNAGPLTENIPVTA